MELFRVDGDAFDAFKRKMSNEPIPLKNLDLYSDPRTNYRTPGGYGGGGSGGGGYGGYIFNLNFLLQKYSLDHSLSCAKVV